MTVVYVLRSLTEGKFYTGITRDLQARLDRHNAGCNASTRSGRPWEIVFTEECVTRAAAMAKEKLIKARGAGRYLHDRSLME